MASVAAIASTDESVPKIPNLTLAQHRFVLATGPVQAHEAAKEALLAGIAADAMLPFYNLLAAQFNWTPNTKLIADLTKANEAELKLLDEKIIDAETNLGITDVSDALISRASYLAKIGEKDKAVAAYKLAYEKTGPLGTRIDLVFSQIRIGFFFNDLDLIDRNIEKARGLINEGGDWDRRNRLKVYEGIHKMSSRDFKGAADLLLDTLATFTSTELMEYKDFVKYVVLTAAFTLKRPDFKSRVINAPEILEVIGNIPHLDTYANSLYKCEYSQFFTSLAAIEQDIKFDRLLNAHYHYYVREMRIQAYTQLLDSYRSLTIESMANAFGVSEEFIDTDLSKFISAGRLNAVIDKVAGIVETNRPDAKNAQYQAAIKQGDLLLTRIQKLSRVISV
ncbi:26S proteasome non-ATPase regulatory subunit 6 [Physocladia obscura]|uniref:26S proteasome non-ATPase regulatory subunit 6 n=1 Tax=Physocladia obscura TaxID=109957 RepID=A0AAD5SYY6_9FUNG|nr:26S proteasome non-ATPase regulatory subunit 6 [Physocladia obscura]